MEANLPTPVNGYVNLSHDGADHRRLDHGQTLP